MRSISAVALGVFALGCGRLGFEALDGEARRDGSTDDASVDAREAMDSGHEEDSGVDAPDLDASDGATLDASDGATLDASDGATLDASDGATSRCTHYGPFRAPIAITAVNTDDFEIEPTYSPAGPSLYFRSDRGGESAIYQSTATIPTFSAPVRVMGLASNVIDPSVSPDGLHMYFRIAEDLYVAHRDDLSEAFGAPESLTGLDLPVASEQGPDVTVDGDRIYYCVGMGAQIAMARRTLGMWEFERILTELDDPGIDGWPTISTDERQIFFESGIDDDVLRIYGAERATPEDTFGARFAVPGPAGSLLEEDPELSTEGTILFFASTDDETDRDLWYTTRRCLVIGG